MRSCLEWSHSVAKARHRTPCAPAAQGRPRWSLGHRSLERRTDGQPIGRPRKADRQRASLAAARLPRSVPGESGEGMMRRLGWRGCRRPRLRLSLEAERILAGRSSGEIDGHVLESGPLFAARLRRRDQGADQRPFLIRQITRVTEFAPVLAITVLVRPRRQLRSSATIESQSTQGSNCCRTDTQHGPRDRRAVASY